MLKILNLTIVFLSSPFFSAEIDFKYLGYSFVGNKENVVVSHISIMSSMFFFLSKFSSKIFKIFLRPFLSKAVTGLKWSDNFMKLTKILKSESENLETFSFRISCKHSYWLNNQIIYV